MEARRRFLIKYDTTSSEWALWITMVVFCISSLSFFFIKGLFFLYATCNSQPWIAQSWLYGVSIGMSGLHVTKAPR